MRYCSTRSRDGVATWMKTASSTGALLVHQLAERAQPLPDALGVVEPVDAEQDVRRVADLSRISAARASSPACGPGPQARRRRSRSGTPGPGRSGRRAGGSVAAGPLTHPVAGQPGEVQAAPPGAGIRPGRHRSGRRGSAAATASAGTARSAGTGCAGRSRSVGRDAARAASPGRAAAGSRAPRRRRCRRRRPRRPPRTGGSRPRRTPTTRGGTRAPRSRRGTAARASRSRSPRSTADVLGRQHHRHQMHAVVVERVHLLVRRRSSRSMRRGGAASPARGR